MVSGGAPIGIHASLRPGVLLFTAVLALALLLLPRRWSGLPILVGAAFIPADQGLRIASLDLYTIRLLVMVGAARLFLRGELRPLRLHFLDLGILALAAATIVTGTILHGTLSVFINRGSQAFDLLGVYFFVRMSLLSRDAFVATLAAGLGCMLVLAALMSVEGATGRNFFSLIGGVPEMTVIREGRLRCQGAFAHPILTGVFAASWVPLAVCLLGHGRPALRWLGGLGLVACATIIVLTASSTPVAALAVALVGLALWWFRPVLPVVRVAAFVALVFFQLFYQRPLWEIFRSADVVQGSTGYHRAIVIDRAVAHVGDWWLTGMPDPAALDVPGNDITNHYVNVGVQGGLIPLALLVAVLWLGFREVGRTYRLRDQPRFFRHLAWALGVTLLVHAVTFVALTYFGQMIFLLYQNLGMLGSLCALRAEARADRLAADPDSDLDAAPLALSGEAVA
jgi:hypothetical protein